MTLFLKVSSSRGGASSGLPLLLRSSLRRAQECVVRGCEAEYSLGSHTPAATGGAAAREQLVKGPMRSSTLLGPTPLAPESSYLLGTDCMSRGIPSFSPALSASSLPSISNLSAGHNNRPPPTAPLPLPLHLEISGSPWQAQAQGHPMRLVLGSLKPQIAPHGSAGLRHFSMWINTRTGSSSSSNNKGGQNLLCFPPLLPHSGAHSSPLALPIPATLARNSSTGAHPPPPFPGAKAGSASPPGGPSAKAVWAHSLTALRAHLASLASLRAQASSLLSTLRALRLVQGAARLADRLGQLPPVSHVAQEVKKSFQRRRETAGMQVQAFWRSNSLLVSGLAGGLSFLLIDRTLIGLTCLVVPQPLSLHTHANCLGLSAAAVLAGALFLRSRTSLSPDAVCALALSRLNSHPGILDLLGAPVTQGLMLRRAGFASACALSGGGVEFLIRAQPLFLSVDFPPRSCICVFGAKGPDGTGIVNVVATRYKGKYSLDLLAVDVHIPVAVDSSTGNPLGTGSISNSTLGSKDMADSRQEPGAQQQRIYLIGSSLELPPHEALLKSLHGSFQAVLDREVKA